MGTDEPNQVRGCRPEVDINSHSLPGGLQHLCTLVHAWVSNRESGDKMNSRKAAISGPF